MAWQCRANLSSATIVLARECVEKRTLVVKSGIAEQRN
jgi:hypothetical protein